MPMPYTDLRIPFTGYYIVSDIETSTDANGFIGTTVSVYAVNSPDKELITIDDQSNLMLIDTVTNTLAPLSDIRVGDVFSVKDTGVWVLEYANQDPTCYKVVLDKPTVCPSCGSTVTYTLDNDRQVCVRCRSDQCPAQLMTNIRKFMTLTTKQLSYDMFTTISNMTRAVPPVIYHLGDLFEPKAIETLRAQHAKQQDIEQYAQCLHQASGVVDEFVYLWFLLDDQFIPSDVAIRLSGNYTSTQKLYETILHNHKVAVASGIESNPPLAGCTMYETIIIYSYFLNHKDHISHISKMIELGVILPAKHV